MFGIGPQELILILVGALIIFGPQRLPEIASQVGKAIRDFRRMSDDLTGEFQRSMNLDEPTPTPPALTGEIIPANSTPNGIGDAIAQSLRVETVPTEEPDSAAIPDAPAETQPPAAQPPQDLVISLAPVATKTDPLAGVSLLDEPTTYVGPKSNAQEAINEVAQSDEIATDDIAATATATAAIPYTYESSTIPESTIESSGEASAAPAQGGIADAWDAVISTEATASAVVAAPPAEEDVAEAPAPLYPVGTYPTESSPFPEPERERVDPVAEPTIREKIEAQVAAEAFRERRRIAHYQRPRSKRSE